MASWRVLSVRVCLSLVVLLAFSEFFTFHVNRYLISPDPVPQGSRRASSEKKLGVIIRAFQNNTAATISMLWQFEHMMLASNTGIKIAILIVPTELSAVEPLRRAVNDFWRGPRGPNADAPHSVEVLEVMGFPLHPVTHTICTDKYRAELARSRPDIDSLSQARVCAVDCVAHYQVTDIAISAFLQSDPSLRYLLVTNGDNMYAPSFLDDGIAAFGYNELNRETRRDLVISDMVHSSERLAIRAQPRVGKVDLGGVLMRVDFLVYKKLTSFVRALADTRGERLTPLDYFQADGNFVETAVNLGARVATVGKLNFFHN